MGGRLPSGVWSYDNGLMGARRLCRLDIVRIDVRCGNSAVVPDFFLRGGFDELSWRHCSVGLLQRFDVEFAHLKDCLHDHPGFAGGLVAEHLTASSALSSNHRNGLIFCMSLSSVRNLGLDPRIRPITITSTGRSDSRCAMATGSRSNLGGRGKSGVPARVRKPVAPDQSDWKKGGPS